MFNIGCWILIYFVLYVFFFFLIIDEGDEGFVSCFDFVYFGDGDCVRIYL